MAKPTKLEPNPLLAGMIKLTIRRAWRAIIAVVGLTVLGLGVLMIITPGPAMVLIPAGLTILAAEFVWARKLLKRVKIYTRRKMRQIRQQANERSSTN